MTTLIEYAARRACDRFERNGSMFNTAGFQQEFSRLTDSRPMVTATQAEAILLSVPKVHPLPGYHWTFAK
jgi:hypothetical protein